MKSKGLSDEDIPKIPPFKKAISKEKRVCSITKGITINSDLSQI